MNATNTSTTKPSKKMSYKVIGFAPMVDSRDIEVHVKASSVQGARAEAMKADPLLATYKDIRIYVKSGWVRAA